MAKKNFYSDEFKRDAIRLQETSGKSVGEIERELGLSHNRLRQWKKRYQVDDETNGLERREVEQLKAELRQARRELEIARQERDILTLQPQLGSDKNAINKLSRQPIA